MQYSVASPQFVLSSWHLPKVLIAPKATEGKGCAIAKERPPPCKKPLRIAKEQIQLAIEGAKTCQWKMMEKGTGERRKSVFLCLCLCVIGDGGVRR